MNLTPKEAAAKYRSLEYRGLGDWITPQGEFLNSDEVADLRHTLADAYLEQNPADDEEAIWTDEQVFQLNASQHRGDIHPYTCGNDSRHRPLIATRYGWRCADCDYRQNWAHGINK